MTEHGTDAEVAGCPEVIRTLVSDDGFVETTREMDATATGCSNRSSNPPSFPGILDDVVQFGVDEAGEPRALIESTHPGVRVWAERTDE